MIRVVVAALVLSAFLGCGGGGPRKEAAESYIIKSVLADPSKGSIIIDIALDPQARESEVKAAAEGIIAKHKNEYSSIVVKTHLSSDTSGLPYGTSILEGGVISHSFNPRAIPEKIKTH